MAHLIDVAPEETLVAIRSKLIAAPERDVLLVVPRGTKALQSAVGAKIIARAALDCRLRFAIVTRDAEVHRYAEEAGLSVFSRVGGAERAKRWRTPKVRSRQAATLTSTSRRARPDTRSWPERLLGMLLLLVLLFGVGAASALLIPEGSVAVRPAKQAIAATVRLAVQPGLEDVDYGSVAIPGRIVTTIVQGTWSQPTTSRMDTPDQKATGTALFVNQLATPITLPVGTIVSTGSGVPIRFRTTAEAQLPGQRGATIQVPIEAIDPGPQGNVGAYLINTIPGLASSHVSVINEQPTQGGSVRQVGVVTQADKDRLRAGLLQRLDSEAHNALQSLLEPGEIAPRETLVQRRIFGEGYDKMLDEAADQLTMTLRVEYEELAFKGIDANRIALAGLQGVVPEGYRLTAEGLSFEITAVELDENRNLFLTVTTKGIAQATLDDGDVRSLVLGKTPQEAQRLLSESLPLAEPAEVRLSPSWSPTLPRFPFRVRVSIRE
ncbi:MAG: baseplate J/gp47 family protein [Anaerolineae bacterium]